MGWILGYYPLNPISLKNDIPLESAPKQQLASTGYQKQLKDQKGRQSFTVPWKEGQQTIDRLVGSHVPSLPITINTNQKSDLINCLTCTQPPSLFFFFRFFSFWSSIQSFRSLWISFRRRVLQGGYWFYFIVYFGLLRPLQPLVLEDFSFRRGFRTMYQARSCSLQVILGGGSLAISRLGVCENFLSLSNEILLTLDWKMSLTESVIEFFDWIGSSKNLFLGLLSFCAMFFLILGRTWESKNPFRLKLYCFQILWTLPFLGA